jgi:cytidyltransferase-like protein
MTNKIYPLESLPTLLQDISGKKKVIAGGCFDLLHYGHVTFLANAKKEGDALIILLESDAFIKKYKRKVPVHTQQERAEILSQLIPVDYVINLPDIMNYEEYLDLVQQVKPTIIAITEGDARKKDKEKQAALVGAEVKEVSRLLPFASSTILYETIFRD